jgi:hypothetical protein
MSAVRPLIIIPIYKEASNWKRSEYESIKQCFKILGKYDVYLIGPPGLNWSSIKELIQADFNSEFDIAIFDPVYFTDISGYNKLLKSLFFYQYFSAYTHLLIYQPDAYVFKDELIYWCNKGFDYIGAPWLEGYSDNCATKFVGVGNGGFSLHNIKTSIKVLKRIKSILQVLEPIERLYLVNNISLFKFGFRFLLLKTIYRIKNQKYVLGLSLNDEIYEDKFWGKYMPTTFGDFKVANVEEAIKFSFEVNPKYLYKLNKQNLPFGCHAWEKYDPIFWAEHIN